MNSLAQQRAVRAGSDDTIQTSVYDIVRSSPWPAQYNGRLLRNDFIDRWHSRETELLSDVPEAAAAYRTAVEQGDFGVANMIVGESVGLIRDVLPARVVVEQMVEQAEAILDRHATRTVAGRRPVPPLHLCTPYSSGHSTSSSTPGELVMSSSASPVVSRCELREVIAASSAGTLIERCDFFVYCKGRSAWSSPPARR